MAGVLIHAAAGLVALALSAVQAQQESTAREVESFLWDGISWSAYVSEDKKTFYVNQATRAAQWADPRKAAVAAQNSFVAFVVIIVAVLALFIGGAIYVAYLVHKYPGYFKGKRKGRRYVGASPATARRAPAAADAQTKQASKRRSASPSAEATKAS